MARNSRKIIISTGVDQEHDYTLQVSSNLMSGPNSLEISSLFMSMVSHRSNTSEYKVASSSLHKILVKLISEDESKFLCPHSDWFGYPDEQNLQVASSVCRFCGIRENCSRFKNKKEVAITVKTLFPKDRIPNKRILEKIFTVSSDNQKIKYDPFLGFSQESNLTRDLYICRKSSYEEIFPNHDSGEYKQMTLQYALGYEITSKQPIWPIDQRFLKLRYEFKLNFGVNKFSQIMNTNRMDITDTENKYLCDIASKFGWINTDEESDSIILRKIVSDLVKILQGLENKDAYLKLSRSIMKPLIDIPFETNSTGRIELVLRWMKLVPKDILDYLSICRTDGDYEQKLEVCNRIIGKEIFAEVDLVDEIKNPVRYLPRYPIVVLTNMDKLADITLNLPSARVIDVVISESIEETYYLIDTLGTNLEDVINHD